MSNLKHLNCKKQSLTKLEHITLLALLTALTALSLDTILPAFGLISSEFSAIGTISVQYVVILFIFGMVFGELIFGPLSDATGRKNAILIGLTIYTIGTLIAIFSSSMELLLAGRIIQGVGVAGSKIGSRALIRDLYAGAQMAKILSVIFSILVLVPMLAPVMGQLIMVWFSWRAIFILLLILCAIIIIWLTTRLEETLADRDRIPISFANLYSNAILVLRHPKIMAYTFCAGLIFGAQLLFIALAHSLFVDLYQMGSKFPYYFALMGLGIGLGAFLNSRMVQKFGMHNMTLAALINISIFSAALAAISFHYQHKPPFFLFLAAGILMFFSVGVVIGNINAMAMQSMGRVAGLGSSIIASISSLVAVIFSALAGSFYNDSTLPLAVSFFCAASISIFLIIVVQRITTRPI